MTDDLEYPHPDAFRLLRLRGQLGRVSKVIRDCASAQVNETYEQEQERLKRGREAKRYQRKLQDEVNALESAPGIPKPVPIELVGILPSDLRPSPDMDPIASAERVITAATASNKYVPTEAKIEAARLAAYHIMWGEALPDITVRALAAAMSLNRTVARRPWASIDEAVETARLAAAAIPVPRKQRAVVFDVTRFISEREYTLGRIVFEAVVRSLGLTDSDGRLRQHVREAVLPPPAQGTGPHIGVREPERLKAAVDFEVRQRLWLADEDDDEDEGTNLTEQATPPGTLAEDGSAETMRHWVKNPRFQLPVFSRVFWKSNTSRQWRWGRRRED